MGASLVIGILLFGYLFSSFTLDLCVVLMKRFMKSRGIQVEESESLLTTTLRYIATFLRVVFMSVFGVVAFLLITSLF